jgi:hypothetical protein
VHFVVLLPVLFIENSRVPALMTAQTPPFLKSADQSFHGIIAPITSPIAKARSSDARTSSVMIASQPLLGGNAGTAFSPPLGQKPVCPGLAALAIGQRFSGGQAHHGDKSGVTRYTLGSLMHGYAPCWG